MLRFLIFLFPAMVDVVIGALIFIATRRLVDSNASAFATVLPTTAWALGHSFFSFFVGKISNPRRAPALIISGCIVMGLGSVLLIVLPEPSMQFYWALIIGLGSAFFFCSFQVFMKAADKDVHAGVVRSTAIYGFAWSSGIASGPFIAAFIWGDLFPENGWVYCYYINIFLLTCVAFATCPLKNYIERLHRETPEPETVKNVSSPDYSKLPDLVWLGWLTAAIGCFTITLIRSLFPYKAEIFNISTKELGYIMALVAYSQGFFSLLLLRSRYWMYKILPMMFFSLCGFTGMILFWCGTNVWTFYAAAVIYGIYSSAFFFYMVFHSLVHPEKSAKYVSWNEVVVGLAGIIAPLAGGFLVDQTGNRNLPFVLAALLIIVAVVMQIVILRKIDQKLLK